MLRWIKKGIIGTPLESAARKIYLRLNFSQAGQYDRQTMAVMRRCLLPDSNCIDIGAHRGAELQEILRYSPCGSHYAFEPLQQHYEYLHRAFPSVKVFPLALSNAQGTKEFVHIVSRPTWSGFHPWIEQGEQAETIVVQTDLLDHVIPPSHSIRLIKLDVEGAEFEVLQGGKETIRKNKPFIVFEHTLVSRINYGVSSKEVYDLLVGECQMKISLMSDWLKHAPPLTCEQFVDNVEQKINYYFLAHP